MITSFTSISITASLLWIILGIIASLAIVMGLIFVFHWHNYGAGARKALIAEITYFIGLAILIIIAASSIVAISTSL